MSDGIHEIIDYKGKRLELCSELLAMFPGMYPVLPPYSNYSTSNFRGYVGTWAIESDRLYLKLLRRRKRVSHKWMDVGIEDLFPGYSDGVFAHWFTGELCCHLDEGLMPYLVGGCASCYNANLFLRVQRGVVLEERIVRNDTALEGFREGYAITPLTTHAIEDGHD